LEYANSPSGRLDPFATASAVEIFYLGESTLGAIRIDDYKYRFID
jgi:hypothetical protein